MVAIVCFHCILFGHFQSGISSGESNLSGKTELRERKAKIENSRIHRSPDLPFTQFYIYCDEFGWLRSSVFIASFSDTSSRGYPWVRPPFLSEQNELRERKTKVES